MGCRNSSHVIGKKRINISGADDNGHFSAPRETSDTEFDTKRANRHINNNGSLASSKSSSRMSQQTDSSGNAYFWYGCMPCMACVVD